MNATERLRQLLDERGVEWWNDTDPEPQHVTVVHFEERIVIYHENVNGTMGYHVYNTHDLTPEQAVEATLGRGTCDMEFTQAAQFGDLNDEDSIFDVGMFRCTACGTETYGMWNDNDECREWPRYCPNCGRRVVE